MGWVERHQRTNGSHCALGYRRFRRTDRSCLGGLVGQRGRGRVSAGALRGCELLELCAGAPPAGTSYSDTGLVAATTYRYRVRAVDAAGNLSGYSLVASATTELPPDLQPPTVPAGLTATAAGSTQIDLVWGLVGQRGRGRVSAGALRGCELLELCAGAGPLPAPPRGWSPQIDRRITWARSGIGGAFGHRVGWRRPRIAIGCGRWMQPGT